ncbi:MAG: serine hydrolase [Chloroflexi bacterium]|jgi:CubicO group peptidase (beta-lactamase class C family)|nr:serine hydrolase [Chloroflexota bacterium]
MKRLLSWTAFVLALLLAGCRQAAMTPLPTVEATVAGSPTDLEIFAQFEEELEELRETLKIPGFSAAVVKDQELVWAKGFGYADLENKVKAAPDTPYHLASVTKPFAAVIIMQLVEEGILDLESPVAQYGIDLESSGVIRVKHLLSMTSEGNPGEQYNYSGGRYALLSQVIEGASSKSFQALLFERIVQPLGMNFTAPNPAGCVELAYSATCDHLYKKIAKPYQLDPRHGIAESYYWNQWLGAAGGLISTVTDLAKFDMAVDQNDLMSLETKQKMLAPTISTAGAELPYSLGWFSQEYEGTRLVWAYGYWSPSVSSLILKAPEENLTFIILANTDNLGRSYRLGDGDVLRSPVALAFYKHFIFEPQTGQAVPDIDWAVEANPQKRIKQFASEDLRKLLEKELESYQMLAKSMRGVEDLGQRIETKLATDVNPAIYDAYVGHYQAPSDLGPQIFTLMRKDDALYVEIPQGARLELFPQSETSFFHLSLEEINGFEASFITDETGEVRQAVIKADSREFVLEKIEP